MFWASASKQVLARKQRRLGSLVLKESPIKATDAQVAPALYKGIREMGFRNFPLSKDLVAWRQRACWLHR